MATMSSIRQVDDKDEYYTDVTKNVLSDVQVAHSHHLQPIHEAPLQRVRGRRSVSCRVIYAVTTVTMLSTHKVHHNEKITKSMNGKRMTTIE
jgi:hypothetical protein